MNTCIHCGKPVKNKFCNVSCRNSFYNKFLNPKRIYDHKRTIKSKNGYIKTYKVICFKCGKEFEVKEREKTFPNKEKYFCSRSCANTRHPTEETINKIKHSLTKDSDTLFLNSIEKTCKKCGKKFKSRKKNQIFCSGYCARSTNIKKCHESDISHKAISESRKKGFKDGTIKITGGKTKWYDYKDIKVHGTYELRTCFILDKWKEENKIKN